MELPMAEPLIPSDRRPDLDWLRVAAILLLQLYHSARLFNVDDPWHLKAPVLLGALNGPMDILHYLRMPLLMLIAGIGTAYALRRRSVWAFCQDRTKRLLGPLVFGMFLLIPPQIYIERLYTGQFQGSYLDFYPSVFRFVTYPKGSLSWHHLWFVAYLFVYCLLALPLFAWLKKPSGLAVLARLEAFLVKGVNLWLLFLPLALVRILLRKYPETHALLGDHKTFAYYGLLFLIGHVLGRCPALWDRLVKLRWPGLGITLVWFAVMIQPWEFPFPFEHFGTYAFVWWALLAAFGFARHRITVRRPWLARAQELTYPFYIFHQTVIIVFGWWLIRLPLGPWTSFALITVVTFLVSWGLSVGVSRVGFLRPCFGLAGRKQTAVRPPQAPPMDLILTDESR
jgi:peptidoglycan/LPS O-acetylase OafA/YrhL